jgi:hypothetical protein
MDVFEHLSRTPALIGEVAASVPEPLARVRSGPFALVEHAWHMADLERDAFGERIRRLLAEDDPFLPDFDGERAARERGYLRLDLAKALAAFAAARTETLRLLRALPADAWGRSGRQEGVGPVKLADLPERIAAHDRSHFGEIADLLADLVPAHPLTPTLRTLAAGAPSSVKAA